MVLRTNILRYNRFVFRHFGITDSCLDIDHHSCEKKLDPCTPSTSESYSQLLGVVGLKILKIPYRLKVGCLFSC